MARFIDSLTSVSRLETQGRARRVTRPATSENAGDFRALLGEGAPTLSRTAGSAGRERTTAIAARTTASPAAGSAPPASATRSPTLGNAAPSQPTATPAPAAVTTTSTASTTAATPATPTTTAAPPAGPPTLESVFGADPWLASATGYGPLGVYSYNREYFATAATAAKVAQMLGGQVVEGNWFCSAAGSPFLQSQTNYLVKLNNGQVINPGLVATLFTHGFSQAQIDRQLAIEAGQTA